MAVELGIRSVVLRLPEVAVFPDFSQKVHSFRAALNSTAENVLSATNLGLDRFANFADDWVIRFLEHRLTTGYVHYPQPPLRRYRPLKPREIIVIHPKERQSPYDSSGYLIFHETDTAL